MKSQQKVKNIYLRKGNNELYKSLNKRVALKYKKQLHGERWFISSSFRFP